MKASKPKPLRSPYEFVAPMREVAILINDVKAILAPYRKLRLQCGLLETKAVSRGRKFHLFLLGYEPGFSGGTVKGVTEWVELTDAIIDRVQRTLGECNMSVDPWSRSGKFIARLETYIMYEEMVGL